MRHREGNMLKWQAYGERIRVSPLNPGECGKGVQLPRGLDQPPQDGIGIDREHPRRAPDTQTFGQTRQDAHDELRRGVLAMKERAVRLRKIALAGDPLQLAPGLTTGLTIGAQVAASEPAVVGAIGRRTAVQLGVDGALASSGEDRKSTRLNSSHLGISYAV